MPEDVVTSTAPSDCVGVDGCPAGWIGVTRTASGLTYGLYPDLQTLLDAWPAATRILVDIPIGLPWRDSPGRPCDSLARRVLGPRASSVFSPPARQASRAANIDVARVLNIAEVGRSLSAQAWGISKKIAEVDELLLSSTEARERVIEIHPEVCFWALNGRQPMSHAKRDRDGLRERLAILSRWEPETEQLLRRVLRQQRRHLVMADDVLDALSAFVTAQADDADLQRLVGEPAMDDCGLPMQMVFRAGNPGRADG